MRRDLAANECKTVEMSMDEKTCAHSGDLTHQAFPHDETCPGSGRACHRRASRRRPANSQQSIRRSSARNSHSCTRSGTRPPDRYLCSDGRQRAVSHPYNTIQISIHVYVCIISIHVYIYIYIYIGMRVCMCVCV